MNDPKAGPQKPGNKRLQLTEAQLARLHEVARTGLSYEDIASLVGCCCKSLLKWYKPIIDEERAILREGIKKAQIAKAFGKMPEGDGQMLIHLGKHELNQIEKKEISVQQEQILGWRVNIIMPDGSRVPALAPEQCEVHQTDGGELIEMEEEEKEPDA